MKFLIKDFNLSNENIVAVRDECSEGFAKYAGKRGNDRLRKELELQIEEYLVLFQNAYGPEAKCRVIGYASLESIRFEIREYGAQLDPLQVPDAEDEYTNRLLQAFWYAPAYSYNNRTHANSLSFEARQLPIKNRMLKQTVNAVILAVLTALAMRFLPDNITALLNESVIGPVFSKLTAVITAVATPLVFFGVISGITGIGSSSAIGTMGKKLLRNMSITYIFAAVVFSAFAVVFYPVSASSGSGGGSVLKELVQLVLDIVPSNLLECFTTDNDLQVIVIAIFAGFVLLLLGEKVAKVNQAISVLGDVVNKMMEIICKGLPVVVYFGILKMLLSDTSGLVQLYKVAAALILSVIVLTVYMVIRVKHATKIPLKLLFKKQLPTLMINLATSSQVAAMPENMKCCKKKLGIDEKFTDFSLPLGIVTYMPAGAAFLGLTAWGMANLSGMTLDISAVIKIAIVSVIVAVAAPPIPGSAFAVMPIIFSSCSIPLDYYSVAIICGTILGYFLPAINGYCLQMELLITSEQLNLLDKDKMMAPDEE